MNDKRKDVIKEAPGKKTATNNQWTNNSLKYYPDNRPRHDGPGGN